MESISPARRSMAEAFSRGILPHVVQIAAGLSANSALAAMGQDEIAALAIDQVEAIYAHLDLEWLGLPREGEQ